MTCPDCRQDTERDEAGRCLWCHPLFIAPTFGVRCERCQNVFETESGSRRRFCSENCRKRSHDATAVSLVAKRARWAAERRARRAAARAAGRDAA